MVLHDIVAQQERMLQGRTGQIDLLKSRSRLGDTTLSDLQSRANSLAGRLATSNQGLLLANRTLAADNGRLRGRTWAGRLWRQVEPPLAVFGAATLLLLLL